MNKITFSDDAVLLSALKESKKVEVIDGLIKFKFKYNINTKEDLLECIKEDRGTIVTLRDLRDCPIDIEKYITKLVEDRTIFILKDLDGSEIVFYNDLTPKCASEEIKKLWNSIEVPPLQEIQLELNRLGVNILDKESTDENVNTKKDKKPAKKKRRIRITNTHVKGLNLKDLD